MLCEWLVSDGNIQLLSVALFGASCGRVAMLWQTSYSKVEISTIQRDLWSFTHFDHITNVPARSFTFSTYLFFPQALNIGSIYRKTVKVKEAYHLLFLKIENGQFYLLPICYSKALVTLKSKNKPFQEICNRKNKVPVLLLLFYDLMRAKAL